MLYGIEVWQLAAGLVGAVALGFLAFMSALARFLKRPSPSEAIIPDRALEHRRVHRPLDLDRPGASSGRDHVAQHYRPDHPTRRPRGARHQGLQSPRTSAPSSTSGSSRPRTTSRRRPAPSESTKPCQRRGDPAEIAGVAEPKAGGRAARRGGAERLPRTAHEPEHFAQEVSKALREEPGAATASPGVGHHHRAGADPARRDARGRHLRRLGRETVLNTVVQKNIAVKRKVQEEAERTAEIAREQEINVATQNRPHARGKGQGRGAAVKAEIAQQEAIQSRDLQRQAAIALEKARKEEDGAGGRDRQAEGLGGRAGRQAEDIEAAKVDKEIALTQQGKGGARKADAKARRRPGAEGAAEQQVTRLARFAEAERDKQVAIVAAQKAAEQERIRAEVGGLQEEGGGGSFGPIDQDPRAGRRRYAAEKQAQSITRLAECNREAGLKEADVQREKLAAANSKSRELFLQETALRLLEVAPRSSASWSSQPSASARSRCCSLAESGMEPAPSRSSRCSATPWGR